MAIVTLHVNGDDYTVDVTPSRLLVDTLREDLGLTGTKKGCSVGECGACTVLMDGKAVNSCMVLTVRAEGKDITTIEGLSSETSHAIQQAFVEHGAIQCGFCTPGFVMSAAALLAENPHPTEEEIRKAISGNLCRCTGYHQIVDAISDVAENGMEEASSHD